MRPIILLLVVVFSASNAFALKRGEVVLEAGVGAGISFWVESSDSKTCEGGNIDTGFVLRAGLAANQRTVLYGFVDDSIMSLTHSDDEVSWANNIIGIGFTRHLGREGKKPYVTGGVGISRVEPDKAERYYEYRGFGIVFGAGFPVRRDISFELGGNISVLDSKGGPSSVLMFNGRAMVVYRFKTGF